MASTEVEIDAATTTVDAVQEETNILEEHSALREENNDEKEENPSTQSSSKTSDNKGSSDLKHSNVRIVRGSKRMRLDIDSSHSNEKKGINIKFNMYK
jgi:hypothetical protein